MSTWKIQQIGKKPKLNNPIFIEGLPGIGNVGKVAIDVIIDELKIALIDFEFVWSAMIVDNPYDTALSVLFEKNTETIDNFAFRTFSTEESAKNWIKRGIHINWGYKI